jgi:hypothetical protein
MPKKAENSQKHVKKTAKTSLKQFCVPPTQKHRVLLYIACQILYTKLIQRAKKGQISGKRGQ